MERRCLHCGQPNTRARHARYCTHECTLAAQSAARKLARTQAKPRPRCCRGCGVTFTATKHRQRYCTPDCRRKIRLDQQRLRARAIGTAQDRTQRVCAVCDTAFVSRRYSQRYCSRGCAWYAGNARRIDKVRKTAEDRRVSPEMILKRAAAVRAKWTDGERRRHDKLLPVMPPIRPRPAISQAARVRSHLETGNHYGALRIASRWRRLGEHRAAIQAAWAAWQDPQHPDRAALIAEGIQALHRHLSC
jgi:hypothetical protein